MKTPEMTDEERKFAQKTMLIGLAGGILLIIAIYLVFYYGI